MINVKKETNTTLLEALENEGHPVYSECRKGVCGACVNTLVSGEVAYVRKPLAYYREGQVVLCCAKAITDVVIDLD